MASLIAFCAFQERTQHTWQHSAFRCRLVTRTHTHTHTLARSLSHALYKHINCQANVLLSRIFRTAQRQSVKWNCGCSMWLGRDIDGARKGEAEPELGMPQLLREKIPLMQTWQNFKCSRKREKQRISLKIV